MSGWRYTGISGTAARYGLLGLLLIAIIAGVVYSNQRSGADVLLPSGFQDVLVASGIDSPTSLAFTPDGRVLVAEKSGDLRVIKDGVLLSEPFLSVSPNTQGERGLIGVAVDPDFESNGFVYIYYTQQTQGFPNRISRFTVAQTGLGDTADPASETVMLDDIVGTENSLLHNGGALQFGADGMLYVGVGDFLNRNNAQDPTLLQGSVLRLDVANYPDVVPADNPDWGVPGARGEIWAIGFRNPFSLAVDPVTGELRINDVGEFQWEEVNTGVAGGNYGWPTCEGPCSPTDPSMVDPIYEYARGNGAAITGGTFYRGDSFPAEYHGDYFIVDYLQGFIRALQPDLQAEGFATDVDTGPVHLSAGPDGAIYYATQFEDSVRRIEFVGDGNSFPTAVASADVTQSPTAPLTVQFDGSGSSDPDPGDVLTYTWDFGDGSATATGVSAGHTFTAQGGYDVQLTVEDGNGGIAFDTLRIEVGNPPDVTLTGPLDGSPYQGGDSFTATGSATDVEDGPLPASAFNWVVLFHHSDHTHPFVSTTDDVTSIDFDIPDRGEVATDVFYRIYLTVTDSSGLSTTVLGDLLPVVRTLTVDSSPSGLPLEFDGSTALSPFDVLGVAGVIRSVGAEESQDLSGTTYNFTGWSDGGAIDHEFPFPATDSTLTAEYEAQAGPTPTATATPLPTPTATAIPTPTATPIPTPTATPIPTAVPTSTPTGSIFDHINDGTQGNTDFFDGPDVIVANKAERPGGNYYWTGEHWQRSDAAYFIRQQLGLPY